MRRNYEKILQRDGRYGPDVVELGLVGKNMRLRICEDAILAGDNRERSRGYSAACLTVEIVSDQNLRKPDRSILYISSVWLHNTIESFYVESLTQAGIVSSRATPPFGFLKKSNLRCSLSGLGIERRSVPVND